MFDKMTKVHIEIQPADWHSATAERLWATLLEDGTYRLENSPLYAKGFSYLDVVRVESVPEQSVPVVKAVVSKSGHSTYVMFVKGGIVGNSAFLRYWRPIELLGGTFEGIKSEWLSVDIPDEVSIRKAFDFMQMGEDAGVWHFREQNVGYRVLGPFREFPK